MQQHFNDQGCILWLVCLGTCRFLNMRSCFQNIWLERQIRHKESKASCDSECAVACRLSKREMEEVMQELRKPIAKRTQDDLSEFEKACKHGIERQIEKPNAGKQQDFRNFFQHITPSAWAKLKSCSDDYGMAILLAGHLARLGLKVASKMKAVYIVAYVIAISPKDHQHDTAIGLQKMFVAMKRLTKSIINR